MHFCTQPGHHCACDLRKNTSMQSSKISHSFRLEDYHYYLIIWKTLFNCIFDRFLLTAGQKKKKKKCPIRRKAQAHCLRADRRIPALFVYTKSIRASWKTAGQSFGYFFIMMQSVDGKCSSALRDTKLYRAATRAGVHLFHSSQILSFWHIQHFHHFLCLFDAFTLIRMSSIRRSKTMPTDGPTAKFLYTIIKQLDLKSVRLSHPDE